MGEQMDVRRIDNNPSHTITRFFCFYHEGHEVNTMIDDREAGHFVGKFFLGHRYELGISPPLILPASRSIPAVLSKLIVRLLLKNGADQRSLPLVCACACFFSPFLFFYPGISSWRIP